MNNRAEPQPDWITLVALLRERARVSSDTCAYTFLSDSDESETSLSYAELDARARVIGTALQQTVAPGERALLLYPPGLEYVAAFFGCLYAGIIAVPAYPPSRTHLARTLPRLSAIAASASPAVALTTAQIVPLGQQLATQDLAFADVRWLATDLLDAELAVQWQPPEIDGETLAFLQYTSGSTATPKGVMLTHGNLLHNLALIRYGFGHSADSRGVIWLPPYHDMGLIGGILQPLYAGFPVTLMSPVSFLQRPLRWLQAITRFRATTSGGPNFAFELCVRKITPEQRATLDLSSWDLAFTGAEPVRAETLDRFAEAFAPCGFRRAAFYPCYGLAEATLIVSGGRKQTAPSVQRFAPEDLTRHQARLVAPHEHGQALVGCGAALPSHTIAVVDPERHTRRAAGQVGEIWVAGPSIARGYWGRATDSADVFQATLAEGDGPFLRTGDLGFLHEGELFVTGRIKDVIIIRGRNYYPQDIELTVERCHPALRPGSGAAFTVEAAGEERLVVVQEVERQARNTDLDAVIQAIRRAVAAEHELALHSVALIKPGAIPKTSSGKIQRHLCKTEFATGRLPLLAADALPEDGATDAIPDRAALLAAPPEQRAALLTTALCAALAHALRLDASQIRPDQSISALGLDSLAAVDLQHRLEQTLGVLVPMVWFLEDGSPAEVAERLVAQLDTPSLNTPAIDSSTRPLTVGQQALWFLHQLAPNSPAYTIARAAELHGPLDRDRLRYVLDALVARHAALRTVFPARSGAPVQELLAGAPADLTTIDAADWLPAHLDQVLSDEAQQPFDLQHGPLMRVRLYRHSHDRHTLLLAFHHIIIDLWSLMLLMRELVELYATGEIEPGPSETALVDHARHQHAWLAHTEAARQWDYWRQQLDGPLPALDLPTDRSRPPVQTYRGAELLASLDPSLSADLRALASRAGVTLYTLLLAAFQTLLHRSSNQDEILIGSPTTGRARAETARAVGYFVNPIVLRADLSGNPGFDALLAQTRQRVVEALAHQDYPFARLVERLLPERDQSRSPLFQVMFVLERAHQFTDLAGFVLGEASSVAMGDLRVVPRALPQPVAQFDLTLTVVDAAERLGVAFQYNTDLFDVTTIERMAARWQTLLRAITDDPQQRITDLPLAPQAERALLEQWNQTAASYPQDLALHMLFQHQAQRRPEAIALVDGTRQVSYRELDRQSNRIAHLLLRHGVGGHPLREVRVGIAMRRSAGMVAALLGTLKAGATYVPLDPAYPPDRIQVMLDDSQAVVVLSDMDAGAGNELVGALRLPRGCRWINLERAAELEQELETAPAVVVDPAQLAYIIYTSGSTGRPKGVAIRHASAVALMTWARDTFTSSELAGVLATTSICFDVSVFELFVPLCWGGAVILAENLLSLPDLPAREQVTLVSTVPSALAELLSLTTLPAAAHTVTLAGEPLPGALVQRVFRQPSVERVWNLYGPSEDTTFSTAAQMTRRDDGEPTIGRPLPNTRAYVLDGSLRPAPIGVPGRLYLAGAGLARGYLAQPGLTADRFLPDPFSTEPGARMYDTGDLVRYRADGALLFLGRTDQQVKLRGFRIELGEIEAALRQIPDVAEALVVARVERSGDPRLVAYVVLKPAQAELRSAPNNTAHSDQAVVLDALRCALAARLPAYMLPSAFVLLDVMPLLPNGKINRHALPAPEWERPANAGALIAPRTPAERLVASVWAEVIGLEQVGALDHFFAVGGHSLLATQVIAQLRDRAGIDLALRQIFDTPTVAGLAQALERLQLSGTAPDALRPVERTGPLPLSSGQQRLWFLHQLEPGSAAYHMPAAIRLRGPLDAAALERSLSALVARHEALRTSFSLIDGQPFQQINPATPLLLRHEDLRRLDGPERQRRLETRMREEARRPFDLERGPLLRAHLFLLADDEHVLHLTLHHIVFDGWSVGVFVRELSALYAASADDSAPLAPLALQYADVASWQRAQLEHGALDQQRAYWCRQLAGPLPTLDLPLDRPRPAAQSYRGDQVALTLPADLTERLRQLSQDEDATLFMTLLAAVNVLLSRYAGQDDLLIGTPIAGRTRAELEPLIGLFVNTLVLRTSMKGDPSFRALLGRVRATALDAYAHQDVPFELLVEDLQPERRLERNPLFQVMCVFQNTPAPALELAGLTLEPIELHAGTAQVDLSLTFTERPDGLHIAATFATDLFEAATIQRVLTHLARIFAVAVDDPDQVASRMPLLDIAEQRALLALGSGAPMPLPDHSIPALIAAQAAATPEALALIYEGHSLTYAGLERRATQLARVLRRRGVGPDALVGLFLERSLDLVVAIYAVLKAGGAYLPLDPSYPAERVSLMLQDARPVAVISASQALGDASIAGESWQTIDLRVNAAVISAEPDTPLEELAGPDNLAYVIYTSGSTGRPKGVGVPHRGIANRLVWMQAQYALTAADRVLQKTPYSFDVSVWEFLWPLMSGATLVVARPEGHKDSAYLAELIQREHVTTLHFVPPMLQAFLEDPGASACISLRRVICSGEALPYELQERFFARLPHAELHNLYGPTEASVDVSYWRCQPGDPRGIVPIGHPVANTQLLVLDRQLQLAPLGVAGELYLSGIQLARGYLGRPDLTAERFVPNPFSAEPGVAADSTSSQPLACTLRLYRTGDLCRVLPDGAVVYLGRLDQQVKLRGFRIELGEIEAALLSHPEVEAAAVILREDRPGDPRLVAYVVREERRTRNHEPDAGSQELRTDTRSANQEPGDGTDSSQRLALDSNALRVFLSARLPDYMIPAIFVSLATLPLTPNGKLDRRALPAPVWSEPSRSAPPVTPAQVTLAAIWAEVLDRHDFGIHDDFFSLGGHSLLAAQVAARARARLSIDLPLRQLFAHTTIAALAAYVEQGWRGTLPPIVPVPRDGGLPLSFAQQRLWLLDQLEPDTPLYTITGLVRLSGPLDPAALGRAFDRLVARHEVLRTRFPLIDGSPALRIELPAPLALETHDLRALPTEDRQARAGQVAEDMARRLFSLAEGPLLRATLLRTASHEHLLVLTMHHIIADGWSLGVMLDDLRALYHADAPGLPDLPVQYVDYAAWQRALLQHERGEQQLAYWRARLAGAPPLISLPLDRPRPPAQDFTGAREPVVFERALTEQLHAVSRAAEVTLFMTTLAAFNVVLHHYAHQTDIVIGTPVAGRALPELERLIGCFVNTLVLRTDLSGNPDFRTLQRRVREVALGAYDHQDLPFEQLVAALQPQRSPAYHPLFQVWFVLQNTPMPELALGDVSLQALDPPVVTVRHDLRLDLTETPDGLVGSFEYKTGLFDRATIVMLAEQLRAVLGRIVEQPEVALADLDALLAERDRQRNAHIRRDTVAGDLQKLRTRRRRLGHQGGSE